MTNLKPNARPENGNKFFDVVRPGKIAPPASSKSIIVPQRPLMQDPMMVDKADNDYNAGFEPDSAHQSSIRVKLTPLANKPKNPLKIFKKNKANPAITENQPAGLIKENQVIDNPESSTPSASEEELPAAETKKDETLTSTPNSSEPVTYPTTPQEGPSDNNDVDESPAKSNAQQQAEEEAARQELERQTELQGIINGHQYYLPINTVEKRRTKHKLWLVMAIVIVIALVWLDLVLDAGIVQFHGLHPLTHFFSS